MENTLEINLVELEYDSVLVNKFSAIYINKNKRSVLCVLLTDYVPIDEFKKTFLKIGEIASSLEIKTLVFDKRALTTFHQPSMEWYYIEWKTQMLNHGLSNYRKILPELEWFRKAVEIARRQLDEKMEIEIKKQLNVQYFESLDEALNF